MGSNSSFCKCRNGITRDETEREQQVGTYEVDFSFLSSYLILCIFSRQHKKEKKIINDFLNNAVKAQASKKFHSRKFLTCKSERSFGMKAHFGCYFFVVFYRMIIMMMMMMQRICENFPC